MFSTILGENQRIEREDKVEKVRHISVNRVIITTAFPPVLMIM
jgi:hypothetical protein